MARPKKQFAQLIEQIDVTPWGPAEQALIAEAVALAQQIGDDALEYQARMRQTASANMAGATDVMLGSFAWCLAKHDADPARFPADLGGGADLLWQFKWMAAALRSSPSFSHEQIVAVLDDMESHYTRAGLGKSGVLTARFEDAWNAGRYDEAERLRVQVEATPRDDHSHCDACVRSQSAGFFADTDRDADAIRLVEEMVDGGFSCAEEPEHALSRVLVPYLRSGRFDDAKAAHLRSYRMSKDDPDKLTIVADNIIFAALTGNEARALAMVERHLPWLAHDQLNEDAHWDALAAIAFALDRVVATGHGDTPVRGAAAPALVRFFGEKESTAQNADEWTAAELAATARATATRIGAAFDARDATDGHAQRLARITALADSRYDVPLNSDAFAAAPAAPAPVDAAGWYDRAIALADFGSELDALAAAERAIGLPDADRRARLVGVRIGAYLAQGRGAEATALLPERITELRAAGRDAQAALEERQGLRMFGPLDDTDREALEQEWAGSGHLPAAVRADIALTLAASRMQAGAAADTLPLTEEATRLLEGTTEHHLAASVALHRALTLLQGDDADGALAELDAVLARADLGAGHRARALATRARIHGGRGDFPSGAADADAAARLLTELGGAQSMATSEILAGALWEDAGDAEAALARYRVGARLVEQTNGDVAGARYRLGRALLACGHADEAAEVLSDVLTREEQSEVPPGSRSMTAGMLGRALAAAEEYGSAVGAFDYAAGLAGEADQPVDRALMLTEQAKILARFGEIDDAVSLLEEAAVLVRPAEAPGPITDVLHALGQAYGQRGDDRALGLFDEVTAIAAEHEAAWMIADVADSRGRALAVLGRVDEAVSATLTAADGFATVGDFPAAGFSELFAARVLQEADRPEDAIPLLRSALERGEAYPPLRQMAALELGDALEKLGRHGEATAVRASLEN